MDEDTQRLIVETHNTEKAQLRMRIAALEAERDGLKTFIAKQSAAVRALQRRLSRAGLNAALPGKAERDAAELSEE